MCVSTHAGEKIVFINLFFLGVFENNNVTSEQRLCSSDCAKGAAVQRPKLEQLASYASSGAWACLP